MPPPVILGSIAKFTILQYRQCIAGGGFATKSRRSYCPRKADGFAAAFSGIANNTVVCSRGQYIRDIPSDCLLRDETKIKYDYGFGVLKWQGFYSHRRRCIFAHCVYVH